MPSDETARQLDALIERGAPISEFLPFFRFRREAARYLASAYAARFHPDEGGEECVVCGGAPATAWLAYRWTAVFFSGFGFGPVQGLKLALGHVGLKMKQESLSFDTYHPVCESCGDRIRRRRWIANVLNFVGLFIAVIAGTMSIAAWSAVVYFDKPSERLEWAWLGAMATGVFAIGVACLWRLKPLRVPPSLRFLAHRPFFYQSSKVFKFGD